MQNKFIFFVGIGVIMSFFLTIISFSDVQANLVSDSGAIQSSGVLDSDFLESIQANGSLMKEVLEDHIVEMSTGHNLWEEAVFLEIQTEQIIFYRSAYSGVMYNSLRTVYAQCQRSGYTCYTLSSSDAVFDSSKDYYIRMRTSEPFVLHSCSGAQIPERQEDNSWACVLPQTELQDSSDQDAEGDGQEGDNSSNTIDEEESTSPQEDEADQSQSSTQACRQGETHDQENGECIIRLQKTTNTCSGDFSARRYVGPIIFPAGGRVESFSLEGNSVFAFLSTGRKENGDMYQWKGNGCVLNGENIDCCGQNEESPNYSFQGGEEVYLSIRGKCATSTTQRAELEIRYTPDASQ